MYQVVDCLNDESIVTQKKREADKICADKGGNDNGYYVFPVDQVKREDKPKVGNLFDNL